MGACLHSLRRGFGDDDGQRRAGVGVLCRDLEGLTCNFVFSEVLFAYVLRHVCVFGILKKLKTLD
jgi:hypothetical protein